MARFTRLRASRRQLAWVFAAASLLALGTAAELLRPSPSAAEASTFYAAACRGDWQLPELAAGLPGADQTFWSDGRRRSEAAAHELFSRSLTCEGFSGQLPAGATLRSATLTLLWRSAAGREEVETVWPAAEVATATVEVLPLPAAEVVPPAELPPADDQLAEPLSWLVATAHAEEPEAADAVTLVVTDVETVSAPGLSEAGEGSVPEAKPDPVDESVLPEQKPEGFLDDSAAPSSGLGSAALLPAQEQPGVVSPPPDPFVVELSTDGRHWQGLGAIAAESGEVTFELPPLTAAELGTLAVRIRTTVDDWAGSAWLDAVLLNVSFDSTSSPLARDPLDGAEVIRRLDQLVDTHAVYLVRAAGGQLELWLRYSENSGFDPQWVLLEAGDSLEPGMAIDVGEGYVTWLSNGGSVASSVNTRTNAVSRSAALPPDPFTE